MASDIERVAKALNALASDTGRTGQGVTHAVQEAARLLDRAQALRNSGVSVARLVGQLQAALDKGRSAAAGVEQIERTGHSFADRLADRAGGGQGTAGFLADVSIGFATALSFLGSPQSMLSDSPDTTGAGEVGGSSMIDRSLSAQSDLDDLHRFNRDRSDKMIRPEGHDPNRDS
ncbi:hypothetical protein GCM10009645_17000 [Mycolicibacterium poriferae]|uniref:Uncharacterized protein n=1 Tax=Mycolicibacterium poriferae TaxID=39694 RepID=A0A6N4V7W6_9MYCO|nr:hypothetical protein [Mycolicibacterium poriferae]MCV7262971.1 hypothetical protein [Mycolicibacterium poriferae]BBX50529.1 hypothetical protein MPOR_15550 [Mycolicibacterium poriferae]